MGRKRKPDWHLKDEHYKYIGYITPIILVCVYTILLIPVIVFIIYLYKDLIETIITNIKRSKLEKELKKKYKSK